MQVNCSTICKAVHNALLAQTIEEQDEGVEEPSSAVNSKAVKNVYT